MSRYNSLRAEVLRLLGPFLVPFLIAYMAVRYGECVLRGGHDWGDTGACRRCAIPAPEERPPATETMDRGAVQVADAILTLVVLVGILAISPILQTLVGMLAGSTSGLTQLVLQLVVPLLILGLIVSVGVSARGGS